MGALRCGHNANNTQQWQSGGFGAGFRGGKPGSRPDWQYNRHSYATAIRGHQYLRREFHYTEQKVRWERPELFAVNDNGTADGDCSLNRTLGALTSSASAAADIDGSLSRTLSTLTVSAAGGVDIDAQLIRTLASVVQGAAATLEIGGDLTKALGGLTLDADGDAAAPGMDVELNQALSAVQCAGVIFKWDAQSGEAATWTAPPSDAAAWSNQSSANASWNNQSDGSGNWTPQSGSPGDWSAE